mgnify:CR=1 FL=1
MQSKRADIRIINSETLSDNWYNLKKYTFDLQRSDGDWQRQEREVYDRGITFWKTTDHFGDYSVDNSPGATNPEHNEVVS